MARGPTSGSKKIMLQFQLLTEMDYFTVEVERIRRAIGIPKDGFNSRAEPIHSQDLVKAYRLQSKQLLGQLPVPSTYLSALVRDYVFYNEITFTAPNVAMLPDVCEVESAQSELDEYSLNDDPDAAVSVRRHTDMLEEKLYRYPVAVRIHSDASQRDVIDFIQSNWGSISEYQRQYSDPRKKASIKNSKTARSKKIRDNFIFEHKDLSQKKIAKLVWDQFKEHVDVGNIGKIISAEEKRRKV